MANVIIIPARLRSERFPRKLLRSDSGKPLIRHTHERCLAVPGVDRVVVAADGDEIAAAIRSYGGEVVLTPPDLPSGTDRVARATRELGLDPGDHVVNVQGDEPRIEPEHVRALFEILESGGSGGEYPCDVATLASLRSFDEPGSVEAYEDPNRVKVVTDPRGYALYFSRSPIPYLRDGIPTSSNGASTAPPGWMYHVGVYGFRPGSLERFASAAPTPLERSERLEQLRFLEMGVRLRVGVVSEAAPGIDTEEDYERFLRDSGVS